MELSHEHKQFIADLVKNGVYPDEDAAIRHAVELLRLQSQLREDVRAGIQLAENGQLLPADDVLTRLERRAEEIERSARGE